MNFRRNQSFERDLRQSPEFRKGLKAPANAIKRHAEQGAPTGGTGGYARRFTLTVDQGKWRVGNTDIAAHLIEFGSANNPPYAPLRRGVRAAGLRLDENTQ